MLSFMNTICIGIKRNIAVVMLNVFHAINEVSHGGTMLHHNGLPEMRRQTLCPIGNKNPKETSLLLTVDLELAGL
jgi:hypothetical protein